MSFGGEGEGVARPLATRAPDAERNPARDKATGSTTTSAATYRVRAGMRSMAFRARLLLGFDLRDGFCDERDSSILRWCDGRSTGGARDHARTRRVGRRRDDAIIVCDC